jgi:ADP-ribose pyrophosphatase
MKPWKRIEPTKVDKIGWRTIVTKTFEMPDGQVAEFQTIGGEGRHCIAAIALTPDNQVIVARQFRPGPEKIFDELPGGGVEALDTDYETAARRELLEETGYEAGVIDFLGDVYKDANTNTTWHYFVARDCTPHARGQQLDDNEHVEVRLITIDQFLKNARNGRMTDIGAVFLAYERLLKLKEIS